MQVNIPYMDPMGYHPNRWSQNWYSNPYVEPYSYVIYSSVQIYQMISCQSMIEIIRQNKSALKKCAKKKHTLVCFFGSCPFKSLSLFFSAKSLKFGLQKSRAVSGCLNRWGSAIYNHPLGRKNTTYIPLIVLAFRGAPYATKPTYQGNHRKNVLKKTSEKCSKFSEAKAASLHSPNQKSCTSLGLRASLSAVPTAK